MPTQDNDKLYLIIIVAMIGVFLYLYQLKVTNAPILSDVSSCEMCKKYHISHLKKPKHVGKEKKQKKEKKEHNTRNNKKKKVSFKNVKPVVDTNESEISLESLNTNDRDPSEQNMTKDKCDNDTDISLDI